MKSVATSYAPPWALDQEPQPDAMEVGGMRSYEGDIIEVWFRLLTGTRRRGFLDGDNRWHRAEIVRVRGRSATLRLVNTTLKVDWISDWELLAPLGTHLIKRPRVKPPAAAPSHGPHSLKSHLTGTGWQSSLDRGSSRREAPSWPEQHSQKWESPTHEPYGATRYPQPSSSSYWEAKYEEEPETPEPSQPLERVPSNSAISGMPSSLDKDLVQSVLVDAPSYKQAASQLSEVACNGLLSPEDVYDVLLGASQELGSRMSSHSRGSYLLSSSSSYGLLPPSGRLPLEELQSDRRSIRHVVDSLDASYREFFAASRQEEALSVFSAKSEARRPPASASPATSRPATPSFDASRLPRYCETALDAHELSICELESQLSDLAPPRLHKEMGELGKALFDDAWRNTCSAPGMVEGISHVDIQDVIDVKDGNSGRWRPAIVIQISKDKDGTPWVKVEHGEPTVWEEWVPVGSGRLALPGRFSTDLQHPFTRGDHVDILDRYRNRYTGQWEEKWRPGIVEAAGMGFVDLSFDGWPASYNERVDLLRDGYRVRPFGRHTTKAGKEEMERRETERAFFDLLAAQDPPLYIHEVAGDGNCLFRSACHQVYGRDTKHTELRLQVADHIQEHHEAYAPFVDEDMDTYLERSRQPGFWAGQLELTAISEIFNAPVEIYHRESPPTAEGTAVPQTVVQGQLASPQAGQAPIRLSYHDRSHYNSIIELGARQASWEHWEKQVGSSGEHDTRDRTQWY